jgi:malate dehydrogenase (oxaloacetate-decarboxylating)
VKRELLEVISGKDVLIGVSGKGMIFTKEMISLMSSNAIVFALSNPTPEINPYEALAKGVKIVATGRSDYPNQVNNALVFPSMLRGFIRYPHEER